jgi:NAD(P) transhydrogenase
MATEAKPYDLVVLGGGPAGVIGAGAAAAMGKRVALVDLQHELGGAGVNTGTVPSKTLRETALALSGMRSRNLYGVDLSLRREATVADFLTHERNVRAGLSAMLSQQLSDQRADVYLGRGAFVDAHTIRVTPPGPQQQTDPQNPAGVDRLLSAAYVMIATGSSPLRPAMFPFGSGAYDSDTILELERLPKTMAVVGAGVIGCEYACTFRALGAEVHLIDGRSDLLPYLDREVSAALMAAMQRNGIVFHWNEQVTRCDCQKDSQSSKPGPGLSVALASGQTLVVDEVLVTAGRKSNTASLNLSAAGVNVGERGLLHVDTHYRTNVPHIYATGDVIGFPALASTSMEQARLAVRHAFCADEKTAFAPLLPIGIYTIPEVSMVGDTEEQLQQKNVQYLAGVARYADTSRGRIIGDNEGFLKLLFRPGDMRLLGVHVMGELATEVVHIGLMVMLCNGTGSTFTEACFNVPTLGMLYKSATADALRKAGARGCEGI